MTYPEKTPSDTTPSIDHLNELRIALQSTELTEEYLHTTAGVMQWALKERLGLTHKPEVVSITPDIFEAIFDPSKKTAFVEYNLAFSGSELVGVASQDPARRANIIFGSAAINSGEIVSTPDEGFNTLMVSSGIIIGPDMQIYYGDFPEPQGVDAVHTCDVATLRQMSAYDIPTLMDANTVKDTANKQNLPAHAGSIAVRLAERLDPQQVLAPDYDGSPFVIKPSFTERGIGVFMSEGQYSTQHVNEVYQFLLSHNYDPLIESRVISQPIFDPETGQRLDWNVRAIVSEGEFVGMYFRADNFGKQVNVSTGAQMFTTEQLAKYTGDDLEAQAIIEKLGAAIGELAKQYTTGIFGIDLTVDEQGDPYMFEINTGIVGGLQTIALLEDDMAKKMTSPNKILDTWITRIAKIAHPLYANRKSQPLEASFRALAIGAVTTGQHVALSNVAESSLDAADHQQRYGMIDTIMAKRLVAVYKRDLPAIKDTEKQLVAKYPLELRDNLQFVPARSFGGQDFSDLIERCSTLFPNDRGWQTLKIMSDLMQYDFDRARVSYQTIQAEGGDHKKLPEKLNRAIGELFTDMYVGDVDQADADILISLFNETVLRYLTSGYQIAMLGFYEAYTRASNAHLKDNMDALGITFSLSCKEYEVAQSLVAHVPIRVLQNELFEEQLNGPLHDILRARPEGLLMLADIEIANSRCSDLVMSGVIMGKKLQQPKLLDPLWHKIAGKLPFSGSEADRTFFAATMSAICENHAAPTQPSEISDIGKYTYLIQACTTHQFNDKVNTYFEDLLAKYPDYEGDLSYLSDVMAETVHQH